MKDRLNFKNILDILMKVTKKNAGFLADMYLFKGVSMIYKWNSNTVIPGCEDINNIVTFAVQESSEVQKRAIRENIEKLILNSMISEDIKNEVLKIATFEQFLFDVLNISTELDFYEKKDKVETNGAIKIDSCNNEVNGYEVVPEIPDGEYSGVLKFDLSLKSKVGRKHKKEMDIDIKSNKLSANIVTKIGKSVLIIMVLGCVSTLFMKGDSYNISKASSAKQKSYSVQAENVSTTPIPTDTVNMENSISNNVPQKLTQEIIETIVPATPIPVHEVDDKSCNLKQNTETKNISQSKETSESNVDDKNINENDGDQASSTPLPVSDDDKKDNKQLQESAINKAEQTNQADATTIEGNDINININGDNNTSAAANGSNIAISISQ
ncbi:MAG: hypothetical protein BWY74_01803 [Firmicutes bacterium ADurb.Bin419]|nr:MAG: hypothetical protein BWY74_01803 [Firmicutes bacterium ADurb.Bin419]